MSLNYNLAKVADRSVIDDRDKWTITQALIFETMVVGIGELTEKDAVEFKVRSDFWRKLASRDNNNKHLPLFTLEEIKARVGMSTNVFPRKTWASFATLQAKLYHNDMVREIKEDERKAAKVAA